MASLINRLRCGPGLAHSQPTSRLYLSAIIILELDSGRPNSGAPFAGRILPFTDNTASVCITAHPRPHRHETTINRHSASKFYLTVHVVSLQ